MIASSFASTVRDLRSLAGAVALVSLVAAAPAQGAEIVVMLAEPPEGGDVILRLFDSANAFGDFRDPLREQSFPADGRATFVLSGLEAGSYALLVHHDVDGDGVLDKSFIGIPTEPIALSNDYRPKGPPSFQRAELRLAPGERLELELELYRALGRRGRLGVGLGVIARSSPYLDYDGGVVQAIPALTYNGDRIQWLGPNLQVGLVGSGRLRLAAVATYRIGVYEQDDSPLLAGLGDRESTLMAGLGLEAELPAGLDLSLRYEHDALDRIGGGSAQLELERSFALGVVRLEPYAALSWLSAELASHDFGVPASAAIPGRPAYELGDTLSVEAGVGTLVELTRDWLLVGEIGVEAFGSEVEDSPIVDDGHVVKGFFAVNYVF